MRPASPRRRHLVLGSLALVLGGRLAAAPHPGARLIDVAGRQRMLTQRIVKTYCQLGLGVLPEASAQQRDEALRQFDLQLALLKTQAPDARSRRALERVQSLWGPFRRAADAPASADGARALAALSEPLLDATHQVVLALQDSAGGARAMLVNLAGRQRMLSQRLAKLYMLRVWGLQPSDQAQQTQAAAQEFAATLATLRSAAENTTTLTIELEEVEKQWAWFTLALQQDAETTYALVVADASESILQSMDLVTALYAGLEAR
jgi:Type IV pili methyl-accepting chemotaxis transducer N-term